MNLHGIVSPAIGAVNPLVTALVKPSIGATTLADGRRVPVYGDGASVPMQVQALTFSDIQQLDGLQIEGVRRAIYLNGAVMGLVRVARRGGDMIVFPNGTPGVPEGTVWLAAHVLEQWPDWCKVAITLQVDA